MGNDLSLENMGSYFILSANHYSIDVPMHITGTEVCDKKEARSCGVMSGRTGQRCFEATAKAEVLVHFWPSAPQTVA